MSKGLRSKGPADTPAEPQLKQRKRTPNIMPGAGEPSLADLMKAIQAGTEVSNGIAKKVDEIQVTVTTMDNKLEALTTRVAEAEQRISNAEDRAELHESQLQKLEKEVALLQEKNLEIESRSRRFNLKVQGLVEGREGPNPLAFFETFFSNLFGPDSTLPRRVELQAAHRSPAKHPPKGDPPRTIWVKFLRLPDKEKIMQLSRQKGHLKFEKSTIKLFPDIPPVLQKRRKEMFSEAKQILKDNNISYGVIHPSTLLFDYDGEKRMFRSKEEIETFLKDNDLKRA